MKTFDQFILRLQKKAIWINILAALFLFIVCAIYLRHFWCTFCDTIYSVGNDFDMLYYRPKLYLIDVVANQFRIPLWSPSEGAGYPFYSNPFNAVFYPLNIFLVLFYKIADGYSMVNHQAFAAFGIYIFVAGLFFWLRQLSFSIPVSLFSSLAIGLSFKMTEIMRFPNAIHAAAWYPWILLGIYFMVTDKERRYRGILLTLFGSFSLATAGYPYFLYYSQFLFVPYTLLLLFPQTRVLFDSSVEKRNVIPFKTILFRLLLTLFLFFIMVGPYILKIRVLMSQTQDRTGGNFNFAISGSEWDWHDTFGSWFYPPAAMAEGWYYFGVCAALFIITYILYSIFRRDKIQSIWDNRRNLSFIALLLIWIWIISDITMGKDSFILFKFFWKYWPGFSFLRVWPRLNIILLPLLALLLSRALTYLNIFQSISERNHRYRILFFIASYFILFSFQYYFFSTGYQARYFGYFLPFPKIWYLQIGAVTFGIVLLLFLQRKIMKVVPLTLSLFLLLNLIDMGKLGLTQWGSFVDLKIKDPSDSNSINSNKILEHRKRSPDADFKSLSTPRVFIYDSIQIEDSFNVGRIANWYFNSYNLFISNQTKIENIGMYENNIKIEIPAPTKRLLGMDNGNRLFFSEKIDYADVDSFLQESDRTTLKNSVIITPLFYNGDKLELKVQSKSGGYLSFIDNYDPKWRVYVNKQKSKIEPLFQTFKSVKLLPGENHVLFKYKI